MKKLILLATLFVSIFANAQTRDTTLHLNNTSLTITVPLYVCDTSNSISIKFSKVIIPKDVVISIYTTAKPGASSSKNYLVDTKYSNDYRDAAKGYMFSSDLPLVGGAIKDTTFVFSLNNFNIDTNYYTGKRQIWFWISIYDISYGSRVQQPMYIGPQFFTELCPTKPPIDNVTNIESVSDKRVLQTNYINYLGQPTNECRPCIEELIFDDGSRQRKQVSY